MINLKPLAVLITTFSLVVSIRIQAQENIIYLDACENIVTEEDHTFKRIVNTDPNNKFSYFFKDYYRDGPLYASGVAKSRNGKTKSGEILFFHQNGAIMAKGTVNGLIAEGTWEFFDENANTIDAMTLLEKFPTVIMQESYNEINGKCLCYFKHSTWKNSRNRSDNESSHVEYFLGKIVFFNHSQFKNGYTKLYSYIQKNMTYPRVARSMNIEGKVFAAFEVDIKGNLGNIRIISSPHRSLSDEVMYILSKANKKLIPLKIPNGQETISMVIPITFNLKETKVKKGT